MSDANTIKQLRNEVQLLRDELAVMKRKYEDIIYNLDTDNFSQRVVKQGKDMYTKIEQTAGEISLQAEKVGENTKNLAELSITAKEIQSAVFEENEDGTKTSRITQTAEKIEFAVKEINTSVEGVETRLSTQIEQTNNQISLTATEVKEYAKDYVTNTLAGKGYVTSADLQLTANGITSMVESLSGDVDTLSSYASGLSDDISGLSGYISNVEQTAYSISTRVGKIEGGKFGKHTAFTQTADAFTFYGTYMNISAAMILTDNDGENAFSIFHDQSSNTGTGGAVYMWGMGDYSYRPVIIGNESTSDSQGIYLYDDTEPNHIATRKWVRENAGSGGTGGYAVFG